MNIETALQIALNAHYGQTDKCGEPYILHPLYVMSRMDTEDGQVVAILHDVVEDTDITLSELISYGLTPLQAEALDLLTHRKGVPYMEYIDKLISNDVAREVKIADLQHNMDDDRFAKAVHNGCDKERMWKKRRIYEKAYDKLRCYLTNKDK